MMIDSVNILLALGAPAPPGQQPTAPGWTGLVPIVLMVVVFYFILIRPQQKQARDRENMQKSLKPGDKVITSGGLVGVIIHVKDKSLTLRSADAKMELVKSAIAEVTERAGDTGSH